MAARRAIRRGRDRHEDRPGALPHRAPDLVRYCGASGDFNSIHWNERIAKAAGKPDVIAHGMLTMAEAARLVTDWAGDPGAVADYEVARIGG